MLKTCEDVRSHFNLSSLPFTRELAIDERWSSPLFEQPLAELMRTVEQRMSAAIIAPAGAGKTLLLRALCDRLPKARYRIHQVHVTALSKRDMYREISQSIGIEPAGTYPALLRKLQQYYRSGCEEEGLRPLLIIDESQDMRPEVLATLRILTNFKMDSRLILSFILAGDSRLKPLLEHQDLKPVRQRLAYVHTLRLLSRAETHSYIEHRLQIAGSTNNPFGSPAIEAVYEITRGNLRAIDHLCRRALELAADTDKKSIADNMVVDARANLLL